MKTHLKIRNSLVALFLAMEISSIAFAQNSKKELQAEVDTLKNELAAIAETNAVIAQNLATFDTLDFVVFPNEEWMRLHESHSDDILAHWPYGSMTTGPERHIEELMMNN